MTIMSIESTNAPKAIGPYSQGVILGDLVFCSGQIPIVPATGQLVPGGIDEQTHQVLRNLGAVLQSASCNYTHVVKTSIYLKDLSQFKRVNEIYAGYFVQPFPARVTVEVSRLPMDADIEIDAIAQRVAK